MLIVTADNLPRLMACNGSRLMGEPIAPINAADAVRDEGNAAHWLAQEVHSGRHIVEELIDRKAPNGFHITAEMVEYMEDYLAAVMLPGSLVEYDTSYRHTDKWQINGRADLLRYDAENFHLYIGDLKYGWSIVEPERHWSMIWHAIGWKIKNPNLRVDAITFTIFQPRPHHPDGRTRLWMINEIALTGQYIELDNMLSNPSDILNTGPNCRNCHALATCPAARAAQMNAIDASEKAFIDNLDNDALSFQLDHLKRADEMLTNLQKAYSELAQHRLRSGQIVKNYALEIELTNKQWKKDISPEMLRVMTGKRLTKEELVTPGQAKKLGVSEDVVDAFTERHNKGVKLVRMDANVKAKKLFGGK